MRDTHKIKFIKICSELGAGVRGSSKAFEGLKKAAHKKNSSLFDHFEIISIKDENESLLKNISFPNAKRIKHVHTVLNRVYREVYNQLNKEVFPILLSGDHSIAAGTLAGIKSAFPSETLGVVWIDAHADLHTPYTTPSGNMHGMPLAASLGLDQLQHAQNNPKSEVLTLWDNIKSLGNISPKIHSENLIYVGLRDTEWQEEHLIKTMNIQNYTVDFIRKNGGVSTAESILNQLVNCHRIYISFDVDVFDDSLSLGTGTPSPKGLFLREVINLINRLVKSEKICCFEIVEINPLIDNKGNTMAEMGFDVLNTFVHTLSTLK
ncbi:MAG: arginase [Flavobacteriales bacterium]|nr:arginase [Flavobacteriales bacterium]|tara:strand:- start:3344 stop:4306 length:963 start_codon:yes stop_codon:yes gene_type:complete